MATVEAILSEFRSAMARVRAARSGKVFREHPNDERFSTPPAFNAEAFNISSEGHLITGAFGVSGSRMCEVQVVVALGHPPLDNAESMIDHVAKDVERIADLLESRNWSTTGIDAVFFNEASTERPNAAWVVSSLRFRVVYTGAIRT